MNICCTLSISAIDGKPVTAGTFELGVRSTPQPGEVVLEIAGHRYTVCLDELHKAVSNARNR